MLTLQVVHDIDFSFEDSSSSFGLTRLTITSGGINIKADNITGGKLPLFMFGISLVFIHNAIATVNHMLLVFV